MSLLSDVDEGIRDLRRTALDPPDDLHHLIRVQELDLLCLGVSLSRRHQWVVVIDVCHWVCDDGLGLEVGHALGLAPDVEVAPPLIDRAGGGQVAGKEERKSVNVCT